MTTLFRYLIILCLPITALITVNEFTRSQMDTAGHNRNGTLTINPLAKDYEECTWACHDDTAFCQQHHVKASAKWIERIDPIYFGIIKGMRATGDYGLANVLILVVLIPGLIFYLFAKAISLQGRINNLKRKVDE